MTVLKTISDHYRPLYIIDGQRSRRVESITIYHDGQILYHTSSGWLEIYEERTRYGGRDTVEITLQNPVVKANKENLYRDDHYLLTGRRDYRNDDGYHLYINAGSESIIVEDAGEMLDWETDTEKHYVSHKRISGLPVKTYEGLLTPFSFYVHSGSRTEDKPLGTEINDTIKRLNDDPIDEREDAQ